MKPIRPLSLCELERRIRNSYENAGDSGIPLMMKRFGVKKTPREEVSRRLETIPQEPPLHGFRG